MFKHLFFFLVAQLRTLLRGSMKISSIVLIVFCGCVADNELHLRGSDDVAGFNVDMVKAFEHLNQRIGDRDLTTENQIKIFFDYAVVNKLWINLNNVDCAGRGTSIPGVSKMHEDIIVADIELVNSYIIKHGPGPKALDLINTYKSRIRQVGYKNLEKKGLDILNEHVSALEFLSGTFVGMSYFENILEFSKKRQFLEYSQPQSSNSSTPAACTFYVAMVGYYTYACIATPPPLNVVACALLAYYSAKAAGCADGGGVTNPCAGNSNPCCGIWCTSGNTCINGQCVRGGSNEQPSCPDGGIWSVFECVYP